MAAVAAASADRTDSVPLVGRRCEGSGEAPMAGLLVIMGSGETTPTMIKLHRSIFDRVGDRPAVLLDTPYGFQSNADDITARALAYFADSVGRRVQVASWRTIPPDGLARERALAAIASAGWVFAGPGSPTYALRQWRQTPITSCLLNVLARDGAVVLASAAAVTMGSHSVPVYEIYKAGFDPYWEPGLDLMSRVCGLPAVVIPHYDNAEGGTHDTRYCYLGEQRLARLERELPEEAFILGVDEHTAVLLDLGARTATVAGRGGLTIRRRGVSVVYGSGSVVGFDELAAAATGGGATADGSAGSRTPAHPTDRPSTVEELGGFGPASLRAATDEQSARFEAALAAGDVDTCVEAILALDQLRRDWAADTTQSDAADHARDVQRTMVVRLGELARVGTRDPRAQLAPLVHGVLALRDRARAQRDFALADELRSCLARAGIEVRDTPTGPEWHLLTR
jgi:cyanophycinase-like exopeptidase